MDVHLLIAGYSLVRSIRLLDGNVLEKSREKTLQNFGVLGTARAVDEVFCVAGVPCTKLCQLLLDVKNMLERPLIDKVVIKPFRNVAFSNDTIVGRQNIVQRQVITIITCEFLSCFCCLVTLVIRCVKD